MRDAKSAVARRRAVRIVLPFAALLAILAGGWITSNRLAASRQGSWARVTRGEIASGVDVSGTLASVATEVIGPPGVEDLWEYKISMLAPEGSDVHKGDPVIGFDVAEMTKRLEEKSAERDEAAKQIEKKRADLALRQRDEQLRLAEAEGRVRKATLKLEAPADIVSTSERRALEVDARLAAREVAASTSRLTALQRAADAEILMLESRHRNASAAVAIAEEAIGRMTVRAPRDGSVVYIPDWRGDKRKVGDTVWRGLKFIEIPDLSRMKANGEIDEADASRVRVGQAVSVRLDAHPDDVFHGRIASVARTVQQKQGTQNPLKALRVTIELDRTDAAKMRPGMRFSGTVELSRARDAVLIPVKSLFASDEGPVAYRRTAFGTEKVRLKLGLENQDHVQVLEGLSVGDHVLLPSTGENGSKG